MLIICSSNILSTDSELNRSAHIEFNPPLPSEPLPPPPPDDLPEPPPPPPPEEKVKILTSFGVAVIS